MTSDIVPKPHPEALRQPPFARHLGMHIVSAHPDEVVAEMTVVPELLNRNGTLHGGAVMAICDNIGGTGAFMNLKPGQGTVTVESKTNFLRAIPAGDLVRMHLCSLAYRRKNHGLAVNGQAQRRKGCCHRHADTAGPARPDFRHQ